MSCRKSRNAARILQNCDCDAKAKCNLKTKTCGHTVWKSLKRSHFILECERICTSTNSLAKLYVKWDFLHYFLNTVILGWSLQEKYSWVSSKVEEEATEAQFHFKELQAEFEELLSKETFDASVKIHDLLSDAEILKPNDLLCFCNIFFYASTWYSKDAQNIQFSFPFKVFRVPRESGCRFIVLLEIHDFLSRDEKWTVQTSVVSSTKVWKLTLLSSFLHKLSKN